MSKRKVALFFNYKVQYTLGHYVKNCLEQITDVDIFLPKDANKLQSNSHKLYLCIDDGSHYIFPKKLKPSAIWLVDTHTGYLARLIMARQIDYVFTAQKDACEKFNKSGINTKWLPLGCEPLLHGKKEQKKNFDVSFIGCDGWGNRRKLIQKIRNKFPNSYIGKADHKDIGSIYSQSKIVFNRSIRNDLNMRVFEGLCSGSCLITNKNTFGLTEIFQPGKHLITYNYDEDAIPLIEYYLTHNEERENIAISGMQEVLSKHTYLHRVREMLSMIGNDMQKNCRLAISIWLDSIALQIIEVIYKIKFRIKRNF